MAFLKEQLYDCFKHWAEKGTIWVIGDPHFGEHIEDCGFEWKPSDEDLVMIINKYVSKNDTLIILGDVGDENFIKRLKGYKVLIAGNHDKGATNYKRVENFIEVLKETPLEEIRKQYPDFKCYTKVNSTDDKHTVIYTDNRLFDEVYMGPLFINSKLILSHEPIIDSDGCFYNIHGHKHNDKRIRTDYSFNVCSDAVHFTPVNLTDLLKSGILGKVRNIHRMTIDNAIERNKMKQNADN